MLIQNAILISMDEKREKIEKGIDIRIRKNKIEKIGKHLAPEQNEKIIDIEKILRNSGNIEIKRIK